MTDLTETLRRNGEPWPRASRVDAGREQRMCNLSRLSEDDKRRAWLWLRTHRPAVSALLAAPGVRRLIETFDAQVRIDLHGQALPAEVTQCS